MSDVITLAVAEARLTEYLAAESAALTNQSYTIAGRSLTRADLSEIREGITYWDSMVTRKSRGGIRVRGATPVNG